MIYKINIKSQIIKLVDDIIIDALKTRHEQNYNFEIFTKHKEKLYNIFISESKKVLDKFTLKDNNFKLWCYYTDQSYHKGDTWHNHIKTSTINGVLYLKTVKDTGIEFKNKGDQFYIEPEDFDLLIFPDYLNHRPLNSKTETRISLNMELRCNETSSDIFKRGHKSPYQINDF